jgi:hypothetical protein
MTSSADVSESLQPIVFDKREARYRLIAEHFATPEECRALINLVESAGSIGDGYAGNAHPHTLTETFGGYSFDGKNGDQTSSDHLHGLRVIARARRLMMKHFRLPLLWLDYGHLVFREPVSVAGAEDEFSHPWHFDNQSVGVRYRTHTAILYLNENFTGGLTRFKEADFGPFREVKPEPGKLIGFRVAENAHAVSKLTSGRRYVLNMWFSTHLKIWRRHRRTFKPL